VLGKNEAAVGNRRAHALNLLLQEELEEARSLALAGAELHQAAEILARAEMVAAGYHRHKGEWRMKRSA